MNAKVRTELYYYIIGCSMQKVSPSIATNFSQRAEEFWKEFNSMPAFTAKDITRVIKDI